MRARVLPLPRVGAVALWGGEYLAGRIGPDDALSHARGEAEHHGADLFDLLVDVRRAGSGELRTVLPAPGRPAGLIGPPEANRAAFEAGQALVASTRGLPLATAVPAVTVHGTEDDHLVRVRWQRFPAPPGRMLPGPLPARLAHEDLLRAMAEAAATARDLDLVPEDFRGPDTLPDGWDLVPLPGSWSDVAATRLDLAATVLLLARHGAGEAATPDRLTLLHRLGDTARESLAVHLTVG